MHVLAAAVLWILGELFGQMLGELVCSILFLPLNIIFETRKRNREPVEEIWAFKHRDLLKPRPARVVLPIKRDPWLEARFAIRSGALAVRPRS